MWERASFKCPDGQLFDNDLAVPDCAPADSVQSCGKLLGPESSFMSWIRQHYNDSTETNFLVEGRKPNMPVLLDDGKLVCRYSKTQHYINSNKKSGQVSDRFLFIKKSRVLRMSSEVNLLYKD